MKNIVLFAVAAVSAAFTLWFLSWGVSSAQAGFDCGLVGYVIEEGPACGWTRTALYGTKTSLAFALLFMLVGLINRRHSRRASGDRASGGFGGYPSNEFG